MPDFTDPRAPAGSVRSRSARTPATVAGGGRLLEFVAMQKWEYVTVPVLIHSTKMILDNWGEDGWELVQVVSGPNPESLVAYFKRPKGEAAP
ncbi:hypothetical protein BCD48_20130 [Pseudofrankia sp. BMG5.36]|nr:hypothetical protein BCD48_20130 [Pseudofrankia sp. BMG5.36]